MMREIKFRAWDKEQKKMFYDICRLHFNEYGHLYGVLTWEEHLVLKPLISQYTGLHDRSGREIYEGDIIKFDSGRTTVVKWVDKEACFGEEKKGRNCCPLIITPKNCVVIGNIYEKGE
jgi:uncharacterized phage protein (TIGR01671 family)